MIKLIHGDNIEASRQALIAVMREAKEIRQLDGGTVDVTALAQALGAPSLFGDDVTVVIENFFTKLGKKTKILETLLPMLRKTQSNVVLWEPKEVSVTHLKNLGTIDVKLFKTPAIIFQFLDSLSPNRVIPTLSLFEKLMRMEHAEIVFVMIVRRIRLLLHTPQNLAPWQAQKLKAQAKQFSFESLRNSYKKLLEIDVSIKSGSSPFTLDSLLRQFLLSL